MGALSLLSALDSRSLSLIAWAMAKRLLGNEPLLQATAAASLALLSDAGPQCMSNTVWAFATRGVVHLPLFQAIASASLPTISQFGQQEFGNMAWAFAERRVRDIPLRDAISAAAIANIGDIDSEEAARGSYALAWAQGRVSLPDLARTLVASQAASGMCNRLAVGLVIVEEEWQRNAPYDGALSMLETLAGRSMKPPQMVS